MFVLQAYIKIYQGDTLPAVKTMLEVSCIMGYPSIV